MVGTGSRKWNQFMGYILEKHYVVVKNNNQGTACYFNVKMFDLNGFKYFRSEPDLDMPTSKDARKAYSYGTITQARYLTWQQDKADP